MNPKSTPVTVYVTYQGDPESRFDQTYYVNDHLPLVMAAWQQYGLESIAAYFPAVAKTGTIALCECRFASEDAMQKAFSSVEVPAVMADVIRFTDVEPARVRAITL